MHWGSFILHTVSYYLLITIIIFELVMSLCMHIIKEQKYLYKSYISYHFAFESGYQIYTNLLELGL